MTVKSLKMSSSTWQTCVFVAVVFCMTILLPKVQSSKVTEENCEVCVKFMTRFMNTLDSDTKSSQPKIEKAFKAQCKTTKKDDERFCYYVGGLETSATGILGEMSRPVMIGMPPDKVCMKLKAKDSQICELKYDKTIDLTNVNLKKLKVKDLRKILSDWDEQCKGCAEKSDFVKRVEELMPKYAPEAYEKRQKKTEL